MQEMYAGLLFFVHISANKNDEKKISFNYFSLHCTYYNFPHNVD